MLLRLLLVAGAAVLIALLGWPADRMASSALLAARSPLVLLKSTGRHLARSSPFLRPFATSRPMSAALSYPPTRRDEDKVLEFQSKEDGRVEIKDPYHWLEDPDSKETAAWIDSQIAFSRAQLEAAPGRDAFRKALTANWDYAKVSAPVRKGDEGSPHDFVYLSYNPGLLQQYQLRRIPYADFDAYRSTDGAPGELFFDPNQLSEDGTVSLATSSFSESGKLWAYGLSKSGSDWSTVYVRSTEGAFEGVDDALKLEDSVEFVKFSSLSWAHDDSGFFYQRFPAVAGPDGDLGTATAADKDAEIYFHRLGTAQADDELVHKDPANPSWMFGVGITTCGQWLLRSSSKDTAPSALLSVARLEDGVPHAQLKWREIVTEWGAAYHYMANDGSRFWFQTNKDAPNERVVVVDVDADELAFETVVAEDPDAVLESAKVVGGDFLLLSYSRDVKNELYLHRLADGGRIRRFLPDFIGTIGSISGRRKYGRFFVSVGSYLDAGSVYEFDLVTTAPDAGDLALVRETKMDLSAGEFVSEQVFYASKDGTRIPMTITRLKDHKLDGSAPALLYGYGGFSIPLNPRFSPSWMTWVKTFGGCLAVPALRGGGEYGEKWHEAGILDKKQNTIDDMLAAAAWLVDNKYTSAGKIILNGGSNGGFVVAAATNQAPKGLIGASVADVGVMDLLNFHRWSVGHFWRSDYGDPDKPEDFDYIRRLSPLHNVAPDINPILLTTADHDDRVSPLHSLKLAAELQHRQVGTALVRIEKKAGHGAGKPTSKIIDEAVDKWCWASSVVGASVRA